MEVEANNNVKCASSEKSPKKKFTESIKNLSINSTGNDTASTSKMILKAPKGTRDFASSFLSMREHVLNVIIDCCRSHDAEPLDTPHFELKELLNSKYGEEQKLIYNLEDFDGEQLSLRYDLTVPFARYLASNKITNMRRYQIGKVFRRDNPKMNRGRYREFYQCDFDIAGEYDPMIPDSECILLMVEVLTKLKLPDFVVKVNHRKILEGLFICCRIPEAKLKAVCSSIDKLDKKPWEEVKVEMVNQKGVDVESANLIGEYVKMKGSAELIERLRNDPLLSSSKILQHGLKEMELLFKYLRIFGIDDKVMFDLSLARGLDYYTGVIYEAILKDFTFVDNKTGDENATLGSVSAGGRYDNLVKTLDESCSNVPCVGVSFGVERIISLIEMQTKDKNLFRPVDTEVYVACAHDKFIEERLKLVKYLLNAGFKVGFSSKVKPKFLTQMQYCEVKRIPFCVIIGQSELDQGVVKIRNVEERSEHSVNRNELVEELKKCLSAYYKKIELLFQNENVCAKSNSSSSLIW